MNAKKTAGKLKAVILSIFFSAVCQFTPIKSWSDTHSCYDLFTNTAVIYQETSMFRVIDLGKQEGVQTSSVKSEGRIRDQNNSLLIILRRWGQSWRSFFSPAPQNPQGDPRWFPMLMGPRVGHYFGFRKISDLVMTAPTAEYMNQRIVEINKLLIQKGHEPIAIRFHESTPEVENGLKYLYDIYRRTSLPIAAEGHYAVHDLAFHTLAILLPKNILDSMRARIKILLKYKSKIDKDTTLSAIEKEILVQGFNNQVAEIVRYIDFATGNIGLIFVYEKTGERNYSNELVGVSSLQHSVLDNIAQIQHVIADPGHYIKAAYRSIVNDPERSEKFFPKGTPVGVMEQQLRPSGIKLEKFIEEFLEAEKNEIESAEQNVSSETLVDFVRERIKLLNELI